MRVNKSLKILDCTLRDGGYYNNWFFKKELVQNYLSSCAKSKIDIVELGFRFLILKKGLGPYAFTTERTLNQLIIPNSLKISVMINAADFFGDKEHTQKLLKKVFVKKKISKISLVRIAINFNSFDKGFYITKFLKEYGYEVGYNLMQAHKKNKNEIKITVTKIVSWGNVDYLYYADSIGVMNPEYVSFISKNFISSSKKTKIGIHAHNNKSLALINSLTAIFNNLNIIDSTILGMGRGAGNTPTEALLLELESLGYKYKSSYLLDILDYFIVLQNKYQWGPNYYYHYAAINNIHPTYIQNLLDDKRYNLDQRKSALNSLKTKKSNIFSEDSLKSAIYKKNQFKDNFNANSFFRNKNICILASGPSGYKFSKKVINYIKKNKPIVLSLNVNQYIPKKYIDYYVSSYEYRVFFDAQSFNKINKQIIMPYSLFKKHLSNQLNKDKIIDYGLKVKNDSFNAFNTYCELDSPLAIAYALAFCSIAFAKSVNLAFVDGYDDDELKNSEISNYIKKFKSKNQKIKLKFITPSLIEN